MEKFFRSFAFVRRFTEMSGGQPELENHTTWLGLWNEHTSQIDIVCGTRLENESFRETAIREVTWRLDVPRDKGLIVAKMAWLNMEYVGSLPGSCHQRHIAVAFYPVDFFGSAGKQIVERNDLTRWLTASEILSGRTDNNEVIDPIVVHFVNKFSLLHPENRA